MKSFIPAGFCFVLCVLMTACTQRDARARAATAIAGVTTSRTKAPSPTSIAPYLLPPNPVILLEPAEIPGMLQSALVMETLPGFDGHALQRIGGWNHGFRSVEWMDAEHLLLYPYAGAYHIGGGSLPGVHPAAANLETGTFWIPPPLKYGADLYPELPRWSARLGILIAAASDGSVALYDPDGAVRGVYQGEFMGVSPSGTKLLIDDTWIDLESGRTVEFAWQQTPMATDYLGVDYINPIWSPDETRVYTCCYLYGDGETGTGFAMPFHEITVQGEQEKQWFEALRGVWVLDDTYFLPIWGGAWDGRPDWVSLFDPAAKSYRNLSAVMGVPYGFGNPTEPYCNRPSAQRGGRYIWVDCEDGSHLIDLATFQSRAYPPFDRPYGGTSFAMPHAEWSADGNFVWFDQEGARSLLSAAVGDMQPLPVGCSLFEWHPTEDVLLCLSDDGHSLSLLDAATLSVSVQADLPAEYREVFWSSDGTRLALLAGDNSLWRIDAPDLDHLEQLTSAMPELSESILRKSLYGPPIQRVVWSPDGGAVAFVGGTDIYIVHMDGMP